MLYQTISKTLAIAPESATLAELKARVLELETTMAAIADYAHDHSTGPAVPDALWEIRSMAQDAL